MKSPLCCFVSGLLLGIPILESTANQAESPGASNPANGPAADQQQSQQGLGATRTIARPKCLEGTQPLTLEGDIASQMVDGVDRFLFRELERSQVARDRFWNRDFSSAEAYTASIATNRAQLAHILGVRDPRVRFQSLELVATLNE